MVSKYGFTVVTPREPTPREREERRRRDAQRLFDQARHTIVAILRDYNAARATDLSVDPHAYFIDGELVVPQHDGESLHLAFILHEQTGIDVRLTRKVGGFSARVGDFGRPVVGVETVKMFTGARAPEARADTRPAGAHAPAETSRRVAHIEDRRAKRTHTTPVPSSGAGG